MVHISMCAVSRENLLFACVKTKVKILPTQLIIAFAFATHIIQPLYLSPKFQALAIFCGCTDQFVSDLIGYPKDRFSHDFFWYAA